MEIHPPSRAGAQEYELSWWTEALGPVLDEFVAASGGQVNVPFWEALFKEVDESGGPYVSGWINVFFPYIKTHDDSFVRNEAVERSIRALGEDCRARALRFDAMVEGTSLTRIPSGISSVPFQWVYFGEAYPMQLLGGFVGVSQDEGTLALRPAIGWAVRDAVDDDAAKPGGSRRHPGRGGVRRHVQLAHAQEKMPRRKSSTSLTRAIGKRITLIRKQRGLTLERLGVQDENDRGNLKGHLSNIEHGLVAPTVPTLRKIAANVGVDLPYLVTFPEESKHQALIERTRFMSVAEVDELLKKLGPVPVARPPRKRRRPLRIMVTRPRSAT